MAKFNNKKFERDNKNRSGKGKGNQRGPRSNKYDRQDKAPAINERGDQLSSLNDLAWYARYAELLNAAGSFPFPYRPGMQMPIMEYTNGGITEKVTTFIPGVLGLNWIPSFGRSTSVTDPISIASKELYAKVREKFSGSLEADPPDFPIYLMALDSIFSYIGSLKRVFRLLNTYTPQNYTVPEWILKALGLDSGTISNLRLNRTVLWQRINELIHMTNKFRCPAVMDIFNRHYWLNDNVYTDANSANSQFYVFNQSMFYKFAMLPVNNTEVLAGGLTPMDSPFVNASGITTQDLYNFGKELIDALANSDDAYIISGYLMRAYEDAPQFTVDLLAGDEMFAPVYQEEVLSQIENSHSLPFNHTLRLQTGESEWMDTRVVTQDPSTNTIVYDPRIFVNAAEPMYALGAQERPIISIRSDNPTVAEVTIATRLATYYDRTDAVKIDVNPQSPETNPGKYTYGFSVVCGTEILLNYSLVKNSYAGSPSKLYSYHEYKQGTNMSASMGTELQNYFIKTQFDWAPLMRVVFLNTAGTEVNWIAISGDIHNATSVGVSELQNLHRVCVYSEFNAFNA